MFCSHTPSAFWVSHKCLLILTLATNYCHFFKKFIGVRMDSLASLQSHAFSFNIPSFLTCSPSTCSYEVLLCVSLYKAQQIRNKIMNHVLTFEDYLVCQGSRTASLRSAYWYRFCGRSIVRALWRNRSGSVSSTSLLVLRSSVCSHS